MWTKCVMYMAPHSNSQRIEIWTKKKFISAPILYTSIFIIVIIIIYALHNTHIWNVFNVSCKIACVLRKQRK